MTSTRTKIALLGVRNHGATILHAIMQTKGLELVACFDTDTGALYGACDALGVRPASSFDDILDDPDIEAVVLATPNHLHHEQMILAFGHGRHVFVEKPIANTVTEARTCIHAARELGLVLMVGHNTRRRMGFRQARTIIESGRLGKTVSIEANLSRRAGLEAGTPAWKLDPNRCTLLPMTQLGIHFVDVTEYLFGRIEEVFCHAWNAAVPNGVIDSTVAILRGPTIPPAVISSFYTVHDVYYYRVYGTDATMTVETDAVKIQSGREEEVIDCSSEGYGSFIAQMEEFGECVRTRREPETSGEVGLRALMAVEAMRLSIARGGFVALEETGI